MADTHTCTSDRNGVQQLFLRRVGAFQRRAAVLGLENSAVHNEKRAGPGPAACKGIKLSRRSRWPMKGRAVNSKVVRLVKSSREELFGSR